MAQKYLEGFLFLGIYQTPIFRISHSGSEAPNYMEMGSNSM